MEIGNLIKPTEESGFTLRCGSGQYDKAVVISVSPFIITSEESDMKWEATIKSEDFEVIGDVDKSTLKKCMRRL